MPPVATAPSTTPRPPATDVTVGAPAASVAAGSPSPREPAADLAWDVSVAAGADAWSSGLQGTADPSFAFTIGAGYRFASPSRLRFRLGGIFGYTFLNESASKETFLSFLADGALEFAIDAAGRWVLVGDLGLGVMSVAGLKSSSALLDQTAGQMLVINGAQGMQLTRLGLAVQLRLLPELTVFAGPSINASPKKAHFHAPISRVETTIGLAYRF
jgi:hypothetical protein